MKDQDNPQQASNDMLPLSGLTVVALEQAVAAPYCTSRLADAGARVIKIERPEGDFARSYDTSVDGQSSYFVWLNRGKESLIADIKSPSDVELIYRILAHADVYVQNLAPGAAERAGLGSAYLRSRFPKLITVDITGYGRTNAYAQMKAYDLLVQAEVGLANITGSREGAARVGVSVCDIACGMSAHAGVLEALIRRSITGQGSALEVSLFSAAADWMTVPLLYFEGTGAEPKRLGLSHPTLCPYGAFETGDGAIVLLSIQNEREWMKFCAEVLREPLLAERDGFSSSSARVANRDVVDSKVSQVFQRLTKEEVTRRLKAAGTAYGLLNDLSGLARHPALDRTPVETPSGTALVASPPVTIDGTSRTLRRVPSLGEHDRAIRAEFEPARAEQAY